MLVVLSVAVPACVFLLAVAPFVPEVEDWLEVAPWFIVEEEFTSVDDWFAEAPLVTLWLPLPRFTPGLMFAAAFTSVLLMPTFASTPTFGFTLSVPRLPDVLPPGVEVLPGEAMPDGAEVPDDELVDGDDALPLAEEAPGV